MVAYPPHALAVDGDEPGPRFAGVAHQPNRHDSVGGERSPPFAPGFSIDRVPAAVEGELLEPATQRSDRASRHLRGCRMPARVIVQPPGPVVERDGLVEFGGRALVVVGRPGGRQQTHRQGHQRVESDRPGQTQRWFRRGDTGDDGDASTPGARRAERVADADDAGRDQGDPDRCTRCPQHSFHAGHPSPSSQRPCERTVSHTHMSVRRCSASAIGE